jgi:hypothetical protein
MHLPRPLGLGDPAIFWPGAKRAVAMLILRYPTKVVNRAPMNPFEA